MLLSLLSLLALSTRYALAVNTTVDLGYAKYQGNSSDEGINKWKGMRFAAPPLGELRFRAPKPPLMNKNGTVQNATEFQPSCMPTGAGTDDPTNSEDCLFVNVYAPSDATEDSKLPVYIFIQGGGFESNSNRNYDGTGLIQAADMDMVVVNFNYRVGPYGFLAGKEVQEDGDTNVGMLDQRAVFKWVQEYISKFGGDPGHVTIGGCSAGGGSVTLHMVAYGGRDDGLFHAVAAESQSFPPQLTVDEAQYQYDYLVDATGCSSYTTSYNTSSTIECLRQLPLETIQAANENIPYPNITTGIDPLFMWSNVIDNDFTTDYTYAAFASGAFIQVPSILGDDTNEGTVFAPTDTASYSDMNDFLQANFPALNSTEFSQIDSLYPKAEQFPDSGPYWRTASNAYGEMRYICPGIFLSDAIANGSPGANFNYRYDVHDPDLYAEGYGTTHTEEIGAIWGTEYIGGTAPASYNDTNEGIVEVMQGYWTSFIRSYDPSTYRANGTAAWEAWVPSQSNRIALNVTDSHMETVDSAQRARCKYLASIAVSIQQ